MDEGEKLLCLRDPESLQHAERIEALRQVQRIKARVEAAELRVLESLRREPAEPVGKDYVVDEVAIALNWGHSYARERFGLARSLTERLPNVLEALSEGRITGAHAAAIDRGIPADVAARAVGRIEKTVLTYAPTHTVADTCRKVKRDVNREDPGAFARLAKVKRAERRVWARPTDPGMARVGADLPAEGAAEVMQAIELVADVPSPDPNDRRTKEQRRADALVTIARDVLDGGCSHCDLPKRPTGPAINVTVALSTLIGLEEQAAELNGEPIPAELAAALACDENAVWKRWLTTTSGRLLDISTDSYRPTKRLREFVTARHSRCATKGCRRRANGCDLDHCTPWPEGDTAPWNCIPLCARHHHLKHEAAGWKISMFGDGTVEWITPTGEIIEVPPDTLPVDTTMDADVVQNDNWLERLSPASAPIVVENDNGDEPPF